MACLHRVSFYLAAFFLLQCVTCGLEFRECASEEQAIDWIKDLIEKNEKMDKNLISIAVQRSWWTAAEHIVTVAEEQKIDISSPFARSSAIIKSNLQKIQNMINRNRNDWSIIHPAFQWAQGMSDINVNIKYAHKWDTPATLGCSVSNITFSERSVYVESKCPSTKKKFQLSLALLKELNPEECHWNDASVGRVVLMMKKKERGHWDNILAKGETIPRNMHTWWSMKDQLEKEDENTRKSEDKKREEEDKKKREEERKKEEETKKAEEQKKAEEAEKATREAVKEASKAAEEERNGKKSEEPKEPKEPKEQVEVKADGSVH
ncbi:hypothetical protein WA577_002338 [Blastocystis sp. JDR]